jgi:TP901-1 family phage major tail protein
MTIDEPHGEQGMTAQKGKDLLLKIDPDGQGGYITVAGLRSRKLAFNSDTVDITDADSAGRWRELLAGSGIQRASISGSGIFKDAQSDARIREKFFAGAIAGWQMAIPGFGIVQGPFQITALEYSGNHDAEVTFEIGLESAGALSFEVLP